MSSGLNLIIIGLYGQIFERLAERLSNWGNYRTQSEYDNSLVAKNFLFQFVNNYFVLFYIAFLRTFFVGIFSKLEMMNFVLKMMDFVLHDDEFRRRGEGPHFEGRAPLL